MTLSHQPEYSLESQFSSKKLSSLFKQPIAFFAEHLNRGSDPVIWQKFDRNGQACWIVYDPRTCYSTRFDSETEVRIWLEQRYSL